MQLVRLNAGHTQRMRRHTQAYGGEQGVTSRRHTQRMRIATHAQACAVPDSLDAIRPLELKHIVTLTKAGLGSAH